MWLITSFLYYILYLWIILMDSCGRKRIILDRDTNEPCLERYYLFLKDRGNFPFNIFIHKFLKSEPNDMHDHPTDFTTFILYGGYWEHTQSGTYWRRPMFCRCVKSNHINRIELDVKRPICWALFISYGKKTDWGFYKKGQWIQHNEYFADKIQYTEV